jgi:two-component system cell cycle sensor histidine kinase/response regulator CckA
MLKRIRQFFSPPVFPDDEDKNRTARMLNTILVTTMTFLVFLGSVAVPFIFASKLYNLLIILVLILVTGISRWLMWRGHVRFASTVFVSTLWGVFTIFLYLSGGVSNIAASFYIVNTVIVGLLLGMHVALLHAVACSLVGLGLVILEASGYRLPRLFPLNPVVGWLDLTISLLVTTSVMNLAVRGLKEALSLARQQTKEHQRAAEALLNSERKSRAILDLSFEFVGLLTPDGVLLEANRTALEFIGANLTDVVDKPFWETPWWSHSPETQNQIREAVMSAAKGEFIHIETTHLAKDGTLHTIDFTLKPIKNESGAITLLIPEGRDITDRKRAEGALKESELKYRTIIERFAEGFALIDEQGYIVEWNQAMEQIIGVRHDEAVGQPIWDVQFNFLHPKRQTTQVHEPLKGTLTSLPTGISNIFGIPIETVIHTPQGESKNIQHIAFPIEPKEKYYIANVVQDITERKRAEQERERLTTQVREQAQQMEQILATVPAGVLLVDDGWRVMQANPVAKKHLAMLADVEMGNRLSYLGDRPLGELLNSPPPKQLWHEVKANGRIFEVISRPVETGPKPEHWVLVVNDVTREREIQTQLQRQERLAAVGQLAAGIAHDFNNIMAVMMLYTQILLRMPDFTPKSRERLEIVAEQARRATTLIQQILDFSRRSVLERHLMNLTPFLKEIVKLLERIVPENIKIELSFGSDAYTVNADPTRLQQAVMNLVINARDAMPEGGELSITLSKSIVPDNVRCVICGQLIEGDWVGIKVRDTGTGISPDVLPYIFDPFFTTKQAGQGTGLGLAQVYGIVAQHEGHLNVVTQVGQGTTFIIYLPASLVQPPETTILKAQTLALGHGETILVVEDDANLRKALVDSFEHLNYRVLQAKNGREALEILEQHTDRISLLLSDMVMPEMGGQALFYALRQRGFTLPMVILSGHPMETEIENLKAQGVAGWMLKPPDIEQLSHLVGRVLQET